MESTTGKFTKIEKHNTPLTCPCGGKLLIISKDALTCDACKEIYLAVINEDTVHCEALELIHQLEEH